MKESDLRLTEIAVRVGFRTQGHFIDVFHRITGVTPLVYRRRSQQGAQTPAKSGYARTFV
ncbi:MAG TPA: helix-turn-helix domain-containing protein [Burkholderiaceae bacterium]|nr:helix-turn-helix domain-containing protein [Burkholderiaceae bacterium]